MNNLQLAKWVLPRLARPKMKFASAYDAGFDCGKNGATLENCHFGYFRSAESMREWESGKRAAHQSNESLAEQK